MISRSHPSYGDALTMNAAFDRVCRMNADSPSLGTREFLSETDEVQPNGKVFKKAIYGKYKFLTFSELHKKVYSLAAGLSEMGVKRVCIYMETRAEWMIAAHACFQLGFEIIIRSHEFSHRRCVEVVDIGSL